MALPLRRAATATTTSAPALLPLLLLLLLGAVWGGVIPIAKAAAVHGVPPIGYTFWYALGAGLLLSGLAAARGAPPAAERRHLIYYALCGVIGISLPQVNNLYVLRHVPAGVMAVVMTTAPVFTYALALAVGAERFRA
ncbi:MAG TPA: EamA family transporter, partial [Geminicoccaceae bacterium]|nr:EamA family transporter [Geminicoccaceae bacterium]